VQIPPFSFGFGDRFSLHGHAFVKAIKELQANGINIFPVWNKSHTEYKSTADTPKQMYLSIKNCAQEASLNQGFGFDADHVTMENIDRYIADCDYFTIDVSNYIRKLAPYDEMDTFIKGNQRYIGRLEVPGMNDAFHVFENVITSYAGMYLLAAKKAGELYHYIKEKKADKPFITEISMDEVNYSHSPLELFFILNALSFYDVKFQLISPKFIGRFNKNIDYVGKLPQFEAELDMYIKIIKFAVDEFGLDPSLKLSLHSGSDKFSVYPIINKMLRKHQVGIHVKTSGIGWLSSLIVLASKGGENLDMVKTFYTEAYQDFSNIITHYDKVTDINKSKLPTEEEIKTWSAEKFVRALDNTVSDQGYNPTLRQFMACAYGVVANKRDKYEKAVKDHLEEIDHKIAYYLVELHLKPLFAGVN